MADELTQEYLMTTLSYDPISGVFIWKNPSKFHSEKLGQPAGCLTDGYIVIKICGRKWKASRLAWLYMHGIFPEGELDHWDMDRSNNAIGNLRQATRSQNQANKRGCSKKGFSKGVRMTEQGRFVARIRCQGNPLHIGVYDTETEAAAAYFEKAIELFGEYARAA